MPGDLLDRNFLFSPKSTQQNTQFASANYRAMRSSVDGRIDGGEFLHGPPLCLGKLPTKPVVVAAETVNPLVKLSQLGGARVCRAVGATLSQGRRTLTVLRCSHGILPSFGSMPVPTAGRDLGGPRRR